MPGERGVEAEVGERGDDHEEESPERRDRTFDYHHQVPILE